MVRIFTFLLFGIAFCYGALAEEGSAEAGLAYARTICSECHAIRSDDVLSPNPKAPPFAKIAGTPGMTGRTLCDFANASQGYAGPHHSPQG